MSAETERIPLRAFELRWPLFAQREPAAGVALPDGRLLVFQRGRLESYSGERTLKKYNATATLRWLPEMDEIINRVEEL